MEEEEEGWWGERLGKREGEEDKNRGRVSTKEGLRKRGRDRKTELSLIHISEPTRQS